MEEEALERARKQMDDTKVVAAPPAASAGQSAEEPVQVSSTSHGPATARQTVAVYQKVLAL